ncbi:MAG: DUF473 domain-containing protein [Candidatus Diapherotrites archaeon]|nr:DUF473 domain-containing protein [Candidatus Diapherotrites archaeon]
MVDTIFALSGVKEEALRRLEKRGEAVMEFISFVNVRTASLLSPGERVFLTSEPYELLGPRTEGIVAEVLGISINPVRINLDHVDEKEVQRARVRLRFLSYGRVRRVDWLEGRPHVELIIIEHPVIL